MFERFSEHARHVMELENREAQRFHHEYLGTEHLLLGLMREKECLAHQALENLGLTVKQLRAEVEKLVEAGPETTVTEEFHTTPRLKRVIEYSIEVARELKHNHVGSEHLLLGLLHEADGVAAHALENLGFALPTVRDELMRVVREAATVDNA